jgi:hypothetical protein
MAKTVLPQTLADYVVIAVSPALIMALVGSLVFFLAEVVGAGQYRDSLLWVLFFFVFAAVLIARISMSAGISERAGLYGGVLALVVWLALQRFVTYAEGTPLAEWGWALNLGLIAVIWWSSHRLTWDCTLIDDRVDASGVGLLQEAGLTASRAAPPAPEKKKGKRTSETTLFGDWWQRYERYRAERRQARAPGVWVVYFSLAALPLYGLGQALIPAADGAWRRYVFWLMTIYVASGLGLLLTTSFLGLRRYLRQRKLEMPPAMAGVWMLFGIALIGALLLAGTFLPRPTAEYALVRLPWRGDAEELNASRAAMRGDSPGKGEGKPLVAKDDAEQPGSGKSDKAASDSPAPAGDKAGGQAKGSRPKNPSSDKTDAPPRGSSPPELLPSAASGLAPLLKKIVLGLFGLLLALVLLRALLAFLANFTAWARALLDAWDAFWRGVQRLVPKARTEADEAVPAPRPPRPFATFTDPFASGQAGGMSPEELVCYSFEALEAWARERGLPRAPGETALEFVERLSEEFPALEAGVRQLGTTYAAVAYSRLPSVPPGDRAMLRELWGLLGGRPVPTAPLAG